MDDRYMFFGGLEREDNQDPFAIITIGLKTRNSISFLLLASLALMGSCCSVHLNSVEHRQYVLNDSLFPGIDSSIYRSALPYRELLESQMKEVLCTSSSVMEKGTPDGALGNFVTDVCLEMGNRKLFETEKDMSRLADAVILNNGGLRKPLPAGPITLGDFYEVMPFENQLVVLTCNGKLVEQICDFIASKGGTPVAGLRFTIDVTTGKAKAIVIRGGALDTAATYRVMTADYLANGGDQFEFFKSATRREDIGLKIRDALIAFAREKGQKGEPVNARSEGRIRFDDE